MHTYAINVVGDDKGEFRREFEFAWEASEYVWQLLVAGYKVFMTEICY